MMKTKTNIYDKNNLSQNKTIFISNLYDPKEYDLDIGERLFTMCIEFDDPITKGKGYSCFNSFYTDLIEPLEDLNLKISGYFFVSNIGCSNLFYFPQGSSIPKTSTEQIFNWDDNYILSEKTFFRDNIDTIFTTNWEKITEKNLWRNNGKMEKIFKIWRN